MQYAFLRAVKFLFFGLKAIIELETKINIGPFKLAGCQDSGLKIIIFVTD